MHDRGDVVGAHVALDELAGTRPRALRQERRGVKIVEHDQIHAAVVAGRVGLDVALDRPIRKQRPRLALDRDVHQRKHADLLRPSLLEHLKIVLRQGGNEPALLIDHACVDLDVIDLGAERHRRLLRLRLRRRRCVPDAWSATVTAVSSSAAIATTTSLFFIELQTIRTGRTHYRTGFARRGSRTGFPSQGSTGFKTGFPHTWHREVRPGNSVRELCPGTLSNSRDRTP